MLEADYGVSVNVSLSKRTGEASFWDTHDLWEIFFSLSRCCNVGELTLDEKFRTELESFAHLLKSEHCIPNGI